MIPFDSPLPNVPRFLPEPRFHETFSSSSPGSEEPRIQDQSFPDSPAYSMQIRLIQRFHRCLEQGWVNLLSQITDHNDPDSLCELFSSLPCYARAFLWQQLLHRHASALPLLNPLFEQKGLPPITGPIGNLVPADYWHALQDS